MPFMPTAPVTDLGESDISSVQRLQMYRHDDQLPEGAVILNEKQVLKIHSNAIDKWQPSTQVWPLKYGAEVFGSVTLVTGAYFSSFYRRQMLLRGVGRFIGLIPCALLPAFSSTVLHSSLVTNHILDGSVPCAVCLHTRSIVLQLGTSVLQTFIISVLSATALAKSKYTFPLPPLTAYRELFTTFTRISKPVARPFVVICALNVLASIVVSNAEWRTALLVHDGLMGTSLKMSDIHKDS